MSLSNKKILELAKNCGFEEFIGEKDDETDGIYYQFWEEQLLTFARAIYEEGYEQHRKDILGEELYYG